MYCKSMSESILIVEDDEDTAKFLKRVFEGKGYRVVGIAKDGEEGFEMYKELKPDIVTLDILLPKANGKACAENILSYDKNARIIVVSVLNMEELENLKEMGVRGFIKKPIDIKELFSTIVNLSISVARDERGKERIIGVAESVEGELEKRDLEHALRLLDLFTDILRHDLLNPAGIIKNYAELLLESVEDNSQKQMVKSIRRASERIIELVEDAAKFTKLESKSLVEFRNLDIGKLAQDVVNDFSHAAGEKNIDIINRIEESKYFAEVNPVFRDVIANLVSNAIKYSPENSIIELEAREENDSIVIACKDFGIGVSDEYKDKIFDRFERAEKTAIKGSGLGLAIVKRIVDLHRGKVWVEDNKPKGSVFLVKVPKKRKKESDS